MTGEPSARAYGLIRLSRAGYLPTMAKRWIEAFRVGGKASRGIKPEHLAEVVTDDFDANPRALCFGHPKNDDPAAGKITGAKVEGSSLMVEVDNLSPDAIEGIKSGKWLNRSAAFFDPHHEANPRPGKWSLRHVGLLGAAAPGIPGMGSLQKALAFDADGGLVADGDPADALIFAPKATDVHFIFESKEPDAMDPNDPNHPDNIAKREQAQTKREQEFSARVKRQFDAGNSASIDALVAGGKVLPGEAEGLKTAFAAFDAEADELTFGAGDKETKATAASHLLAFMAAALPKRVPVDEGSKSPPTEFGAKDAPTGDHHAQARSLDSKARKLMADQPGLTFEAAIEQVAG